MPGVLLRGAVLGYVLLLWLAVWPIPSVPVLGAAQRAAERVLEVATLRSGLGVFGGASFPETQLAPRIACTRVMGFRAGRWETLFDPECPPSGTILRDDPLERTIRSMLQIGVRTLVERPISSAARAPVIGRRVIEIGDFFCQARPDLQRIMIRRRQHLRNYRSGEQLPARNQLVCLQSCAADSFTPPDCTIRAISEKSLP